MSTHRPAESTAVAEFRLVPVDAARMLAPGAVAYVLDIECDDPAEALMVEMPLGILLRHRDALERLVVDELGVPLVVLVLPEASAA